VEVAENSGTVDYSVRLNTKPTNDVIVYVTSSDTNIATVSPSALTFSPTNWSTEQNITVTGVDDSVDNAGDSRMVTITHTPAGGGYAADQAASIQVWATDDDTAALVVTDKDGEELDSLTIADEHGGTGVYRVFLRTKPTSDVTVYVVSKDTNIATVSASSLTFSPTNWDSPQRVIVIAEPDDVANPGDSRSVDITNTASGSGYDAVVPKTVKVTVNNVKLADVDAAGLTVAPSTTTIDRLLITDEDGGTATYTVRLATNPTRNVTVYVVSTTPSVATASPLLLTFTPANWSKAQKVTVTGVDDDEDNTEDKRDVTITNTPSGYSGAAAVTVYVSVKDDDTQGLKLSRRSVTVGEAGGTSQYKVKLNAKPSRAVNVNVAETADSITVDRTTALEFDDVTWDDWQTVTVTGVDDDIDNLGNDRRATITNRIGSSCTANNAICEEVQVTILDDDEAGMEVAPTKLTVPDDGSTKTYVVKLNSEPRTGGTTLSVKLSGDKNAASVSPTTMSFTSSNWENGETFTVTGTEDTFDNTGRSQSLTITNTLSGGGYDDIQAVDVTVSVTDTEDKRDSELTLSKSSIEVTDKEDSKNDYTVRLKSKPTGNVTVTAEIAGTANIAMLHTADESTDTGFTAGSNSVTLTFTPTGDDAYNKAQTIRVTGVPDETDDAGDKFSSITHTVGASGVFIDDDNDDVSYSGNGKSISLRVKDDDKAGLKLSKRSLSTSEGEQETYTLVLTSQPTSAVIVDVVSSDPAVATVVPIRLIFNSTAVTPEGTCSNSYCWDAPQTVTVTGVNDGVDNARSRSVSITHTPRNDDSGYGDVDSKDVTVTVADGKKAAKLTIAPDIPLKMDEDGGTGIYSVKLNTEPTGYVTVEVESTNTNVAMVRPTLLTFTPTNWKDVQSITVTGVRSGKATITHDPDGGGYSGVRTASVAVEVLEDDSPGLRAPPQVVVAEGGTATYKVELKIRPSEAVTVTIKTNESIAMVAPSSLTFTPSNWNTPQPVTVTGVSDDEVNADGSRSTTITHTAAGGDYEGESASVQVTVTDDDATVTVSESSVEVAEARGTARYTVKLDGQPTDNVTVTVASSNTSIATVSPGLLTFTPSNWNTPQPVTVTGVSDDEVNADGSRSTTITHTAAGGDYEGESASVQVTVTDDDATVTVSESSVEVAEARGTARYTVKLDGQPTDNVTVTVASSNTSIATVSPGLLTFTPSNWNTPQPVTVTGVDDSSPGGSRSATITHMASGGGYDDVEVRVSVSVTDDDGMTVAPTAVEVAEAGGMATYRVSLNTQPTGTVTVAVASSDPAAATARPSSLTFTPSNWASQTVTVTGVNDDLDNGTSRLATITNTPSGAGYSSPVTVRVTVTDDEKAPTLEIRGGEATEGNTGTRTPLRFTVTKSGATDQVVTVAYEDARTGTATAGTDYTIAEGTLTFAPNETSKTLTVMVRGDDVSEPDETVVIALHNPSNARIAEGEGTATGTIVDDDASRLSIEASAVRVDEGEPLIFTITLDPPMDDQQVTVEVDTGGTATAGTDYMDVPETLTFAAGEAAKTITVEVVDDADYELDETVEVELRNPRPPGDVVIETGEAMVTIIDNDPQPMLSISGTSVAEGSDGTTSKLTFKVTKSGGTSMEATVAYADAGTGTATAGTDYTSVTAGTLTFAPKETAKTITVVVKGDDESEGDETVVIRLSSPSNATIAEGKRAAAGTIIDDDTLPRVATDWLARFGRTAAGATLDAIARRMNDGPAAEPSLTVAGHRASFAPEPVGQAAAATAAPWEEGWARALTIEELADGSSFDAGANFVEGLNVWAATSYNQFEMTPQGAYTMDGSLMSAILGVDYQADTHVVGLALAYHGGGGDFGGIGKTEGSLGTNLYSVHPYVRLTFGEAFHIGGSLGLGTGDLSITDTDGDALVETGVGMPVLAAVDARMELSLAEAWLLALQADGHLVQMVADERLPRFTRVETNTHRLRLVVENSYVFLVADGVSLAPVLETGLRYDGGDAVETGIGFDVGGGLRLDATVAAGLMVDARGHASLNNWGEGQEQAPTVRDWGLGGVIRWQPAGGGMGPEISLAPSYGGALGAAIPSLDATVGYRLPAFGGVLTPYSSADLAGGGRRSYSAGARFEVDPAVEVSAEGTYRQPTTGDIEQFLTLRVRLQQ
jgi:hypothetical protein